MTRTLILIRHAKSGWDDASLSDHECRLTERGERAAVALGKWLQDRQHVPELMLSSDATRTGQTSDLIGRQLDPKPQLRFVPALYHADPGTILRILAAEDVSSIALVGHNPGIGMLAAQLLPTSPAHPRFHDYPTGATTVIAYDEGWLHGGRLVDFIVPRDLTD